MDTNGNHTPRGLSRSTWVLLGFLAVAAYFLLSEHRAHFISYLPFLLVAACPLMHLFHGHGHHGSHRSGVQRPAGPGGVSEHHAHER
jgi:hypothetical protein